MNSIIVSRSELEDVVACDSVVYIITIVHFITHCAGRWSRQRVAHCSAPRENTNRSPFIIIALLSIQNFVNQLLFLLHRHTQKQFTLKLEYIFLKISTDFNFSHLRNLHFTIASTYAYCYSLSPAL